MKINNYYIIWKIINYDIQFVYHDVSQVQLIIIAIHRRVFIYILLLVMCIYYRFLELFMRDAGESVTFTDISYTVPLTVIHSDITLRTR